MITGFYFCNECQIEIAEEDFDDSDLRALIMGEYICLDCYQDYIEYKETDNELE